MPETKRISLLDLLLVILQRKRLLIISMALFSAAGIAVSLFATKYYTAKAVVLPSRDQMGMPLGSLLGDLPLSGLMKSFDFLGSNSNDQFLSILQSRPLAESVVAKFALAKHYGFGKGSKKYFFEDVLRAFNRNMRVSENDYGNIEIAVTDTSPALAAAITNDMVDELDSISFALSREGARNSRVFFSERITLIKRDLDTATRKLTEFQVAHNYIDLEQQTKSSVEALSRLEAEKMALEYQIDLLKSRFGSNSRQANELQKNRAVLDARIGHYMDKGSGDLIIPLRDEPAKAVEYAFLYRDVKVQETLYQFALQMFEQAKLKEANDVPVTRVLEYARTPEKRIRPKRSLVCLLFFFVGLACTSSYILSERWYLNERRSQSDTHRKIQDIISHLLFRK